MNKVVLVGRLSADPEIRFTQSGSQVASFHLAVDSGYGDHKRTDFIPHVAWNKIAETVGNNLGKGRKVLTEGRLQIRSYDATDGTKRRVAEVIIEHIEFLDSKPKEASNSDANSFGSDVFPDEEINF